MATKRKVNRRLLPYNGAQQEHFLLIRDDLKTIRKIVKNLESTTKKFDVFNTFTHYCILKDHLVSATKEMNKASKKTLDRINKENRS